MHLSLIFQVPLDLLLSLWKGLLTGSHLFRNRQTWVQSTSLSVLHFHDPGFIKEHLSKCSISHLHIVLILLSTYFILVIICFPVCFLTWAVSREGEGTRDGFRSLACWPRLVEVLPTSVLHLGTLTCCCFVPVCPAYGYVWGGGVYCC